MTAVNAVGKDVNSINALQYLISVHVRLFLFGFFHPVHSYSIMYANQRPNLPEIRYIFWVLCQIAMQAIRSQITVIPHVAL